MQSYLSKKFALSRSSVFKLSAVMRKHVPAFFLRVSTFSSRIKLLYDHALFLKQKTLCRIESSRANTKYLVNRIKIVHPIARHLNEDKSKQIYNTPDLLIAIMASVKNENGKKKETSHRSCNTMESARWPPYVSHERDVNCLSPLTASPQTPPGVDDLRCSLAMIIE